MFWVSFATATAVGRELSYASLGTLSWGKRSFHFPTLGRTILVLSNVIVVLVLCFYKLDLGDKWSWEDIGYRTGFVSIAQLPLIVLLSAKDNIIGVLTGFSYERLNWLHRWTARTLWLSATLHMGFWFRNWARYDYIGVKLTTDPITQRGFAAWCILTFIVVTSVTPMRKLSYEIFVISHLITFAGFIAAVWLHVPDEVKVWVWLPIAFFALDRLLRTRRILYLNLTSFHFWKRKTNGFWANSASFTALPDGVTRISIDKPVFMWKPGQHVFLSCHSLLPLQSHPFTIASLPSDGKLEFLIKAHGGGTKEFFTHASKSDGLPLTNQNPGSTIKKIGIEGPYGRMRNLRQFDSVVFFAGSTGATFTVPHLRYIVQSWLLDKAVSPRRSFTGEEALTRRIRFIWVVKSRNQLDWFKMQLCQVINDTNEGRTKCLRDDRQVEISVYVTCDEELRAEGVTSTRSCKSVAHGEPKQAESGLSEESTMEKKHPKEIVEVKSLQSTELTRSEGGGCGPDGSCCCRAKVEDESNGPICTCAHGSKAITTCSAILASEPQPMEQPTVTPNPAIKLLSGRPQPRSIIRKVLEEAEGESAVVVCGPQGLREDVRASVAALSDERAVHKGTGAQGIYLHVEGFGY